MFAVSGYQVIAATILNAATESDVVDCGLNRPCRLSIPAAFTGTAITFNVLASDGVTYQPLYNPGGTAYSITVAAGREVILPQADFAGVEIFKMVSNAAEAADRVIGVIVAARK